jgi:squalene-hopene/tetraprenyl-beta-curcumene cyclase
MNYRLTAFVLIVAIVIRPIVRAGHAADQPPTDGKATGPDPAAYQKTIDKGIQFLVAGQSEDGSFSKRAGIGVTAHAITALLRNGKTPSDPTVAKSLKYLADSVRSDGSISGDRSMIPNYETCLAISALKAANRDGRYNDILNNAENFVKDVQLESEDGKTQTDLTYGGSGYGKKSRPDLSNTAFLLDALHDLGRGADDEAVQRAIIFVSRCQNLPSEYNKAPFAANDPDGGFYYTVDERGASAEGKSPDGGLRSYGTMTYAGLKSLLFAGVNKDDLRVKAALKWLQKNYSVQENMPLGKSGLFYYYHTLAKCLDTMGDPIFVDEKGVKHDWRKEVAEELASKQAENGSWANSNSRWMEGDPNLVTAYSLIVLSYCRPTAK